MNKIQCKKTIKMIENYLNSNRYKIEYNKVYGILNKMMYPKYRKI